jgi:orotate phosphoribosyltransferase
MSEFTQADAVQLIRNQALFYRDEPFEVVSGLSHWYIDAKYAVSHGGDLRNVARLMIRVAHDDLGVDFNTVGGPTMGADPLCNAISVEAGCQAFSVRKEVDEEMAAQTIPPKSPPRFPPGTPEEWFWLEGARPNAGDTVLWVEDAISTGTSVLRAMDRFHAHPTARHAQIVGALAFVDRGDNAQRLFEEIDIPYAALVTYQDLGIPPIGQG